MSHSPVLLIGFNRPDFLAKSLASLLDLGVNQVWVHIDAPRPAVATDFSAVRSSVEIVETYEGFFDTLQLKVAQSNLGCKFGPITAIDWFFNSVDRGIILEDDICISKEFLLFADYWLEECKDSTNIWAINGWSPFSAGELLTNGWLSRYPVPWGWATWKNRWEKSNFSTNYDTTQKICELNSIANTKVSSDFEGYWHQAFELVSNGFDAWDYEWFHEVWKNGGYAVSPPSRLTSNIGFSDESTHTNLPIGRAGFPISIKQPFTLEKSLSRNLSLDLALDKLMFGMSYPKEEFDHLREFLSPKGSKKLLRILVPSFSLVRILRRLFISFSKVPGFNPLIHIILKNMARIPFLSGIEKSYRSRIWFS